jgi:hypothetical protein
MPYEAPFETAVRTYLRSGNAVGFSKSRITVVISIGGKIFYDKLVFSGEWSMADETRSFSLFPR